MGLTSESGLADLSTDRAVHAHTRASTSMAQHLLPTPHGSIGFKRGSPAAGGGPVSHDQLLRVKLNHYLFWAQAKRV